MLGAGHADRQGQSDLAADAAADGGRDLARCPEEVDGAAHVKEGLIYGDPLDSGSELGEDGHDIVAELLVALEVSTDEVEIPAELAGLPPWHAAADAVAPGLIRGGQHNTAAHRDGPVPQRWVQQLLDGRVEGIEVGVQDGRPPERRKFHTAYGNRTDVRFPEGRRPAEREQRQECGSARRMPFSRPWPGTKRRSPTAAPGAAADRKRHVIEAGQSEVGRGWAGCTTSPRSRTGVRG